MSPVSTAIREKSGARPEPVPPFPVGDLLLSLAKEMVVDWQMPSDLERTS
jgi:hypothetical protein